jgi:hypothetical protein
MLGVVEYIVDLLAALIHLRVFELQFNGDCPREDVQRFIMKVYDRVPHLEYFSMPRLKHYYKRVGGEWVICDRTEFPSSG